MRKRNIVGLFLACAIYSSSITNTLAQEIVPEYEQARKFAPKYEDELVFSYTITPNYINKGSNFWYEFSTTQGKSWYLVEPEKRSKKVLFDKDKMAALLTELTGNPYDGTHLPLKDLHVSDGMDSLFFSVQKEDFFYTFKDQKLQKKELKRTKEKQEMEWGNISPDNSTVVYGKGYNLYMVSKEDYDKLIQNEKDSTVNEMALTTDGVKDFSFAWQSRNVISDGGEVSNELTKRIKAMGYWSADSKHFIQLVSDQRIIKDLWVINALSEPRPTLETYKYQMPGEPGATMHLYLFEPKANKRKEVKIEAFKDQTVQLITGKPVFNRESNGNNSWLGKENTVYLSRISRDMKRLDICKYILGEDSICAIIKDRSNTYIDSRPVAIVKKGANLIIWSERDGWGHLYLYDEHGKLVNRITQGAWHVEQIKSIDEEKGVIYFMANGREKEDETPYYEHLYRVNFDGTGLRLLTPGNYFHLCHIDENKRYVVNNYSRINTIPAIDLYDVNGQKVMELEQADMSELFAKGYKFPEPFKAKAADGVTDLYGIMYKPFNFDSTKVYPIVNYVYPGPQQEGTYFRFIEMNPRTDRLAQAGFIVIANGHRGGHPSRSKWYHNYGYGNLRDYPMEDHKAVIEQLCQKHTFMDVNRVGIHGHSGGGFMSTAAILLYPDFFKVAVSCAGNHDNNIYNRGWSERHHGVTEEVNENGEITFKCKVPANQDLASRLKGHLLLIHGDVDNNVHPGNTTRVVNALIKAGKRFDMLYIPGKQHHFDDYNEYFYWKMVDYFSEHLKGKKEESIDIKDMKLGNWFQGYQD